MPRVIELTRGYLALVSDEDYTYLSNWKWYAKVEGDRVYAARRASKIERENGSPHTVRMHRVILERAGHDLTSLDVDHIDGSHAGEYLFNYRSNLRAVTRRENLQNSRRRSDNTSGFPGVYFHKSNGKWEARASNPRTSKQKHLGYFDDPAEASKVVQQYKREHYVAYTGRDLAPRYDPHMRDRGKKQNHTAHPGRSIKA